MKKLLSTASRNCILEMSAAATVLATEKAAAATGTKDVIVDFDTDMMLWLEAFRRVTDAETQVIHQVMLLFCC